MATVSKKRARVLSPGSNSGDIDQGNRKPHENGIYGNTCRRKRRNLGENKAGDTEKGLKSNTCFLCDEKDNWVLVCHGEECPITIHQRCTSDEPDFDEFGNFYCPYCWYKRVLAESVKLQKKVIDKSTQCSETLAGVDISLAMEKETENIENLMEVNVSGGRTVTSVNPSGNRKKGDETDNKFILRKQIQRMEEVAVKSYSRKFCTTCDADVNEGRQQGGRFREENQETSDACVSNAGEGKKEKARYINCETVQADSFDVGVKIKEQKIYAEKIPNIKIVAGTHGTQGCDSDLGEGRSGQGYFNEDNQLKKLPSTDICEHKVPRSDKRVLYGYELGEGRYRQGRHIKKNPHTEFVQTESQEKELEGAVERDRVDKVTFNEQENSFRKDKQVERVSVSSPMSTNNVNDSYSASQELALIIHPMACLEEQPIEAQPIQARPYSLVSSKKPTFQPEKYRNKSNIEKNGAAPDNPGQRNFVVCSGNRRRLFWTQEEEEMLRVGVQKFPGVRNIPWRRILEYGRNVFHKDRLPSDLKDKWKKMNKIPLLALENA